MRPTQREVPTLTLKLPAAWTRHIRAEAVRANMTTSAYVHRLLEQAAKVGLISPPAEAKTE